MNKHKIQFLRSQRPAPVSSRPHSSKFTVSSFAHFVNCSAAASVRSRQPVIPNEVFTQFEFAYPHISVLHMINYLRIIQKKYALVSDEYVEYVCRYGRKRKENVQKNGLSLGSRS